MHNEALGSSDMIPRGCLTFILAVIVGTTAQAESRVISLKATEPVTSPPVVSAVALDSTEAFVAVVGDDHRARVFRIEQLTTGDSPSPEKILRLHDDWIHAAVFRPATTELATGGADRSVRFWDVTTDAPSNRVLQPGFAVRSLAYLPDGNCLVVAGFSKKIKLYDVSGGLIASLEGPCDDIRAVAVSPTGKYLAAAGRSGVIRLWRTEGNTLIGDYAGDGRAIEALAFSPDGKYLAAGGDSGATQIWDITSAALAATLPKRDGKVRALVFVGSDRIAEGRTGEGKHPIYVWTLSGQPVSQLTGHDGTVTPLCFRTKDDTILSGGYDATIRVWPAP